MNVDIYSDIVCPWCYVGERRFARALEAFPGAAGVTVAFRPFQLDPGAPLEAVRTMEHLGRRFGARVEGMLRQVSAAAEGEGITMAWDRALSANTRTAHRLLKLAEREQGSAAQRDLAERLFSLHFERGGDVSDPEVLADEAVFVGMDRERTRAYLASGEGGREIDADFDHARRLGIQAVPTFVIDGRIAVQGAQSAGAFLEALEGAAIAAAARDAQAPVAGDCVDGACAVDGTARTTPDSVAKSSAAG